MQNRQNTIIMRSQEHGLMQYFESLSTRTFKQPATQMRSNTVNINKLVASAGGLEELLIAIIIYSTGITFGIIIFIVEYYTKNTNSR